MVADAAHQPMNIALCLQVLEHAERGDDQIEAMPQLEVRDVSERQLHALG
jgi:hypothetical protein